MLVPFQAESQAMNSASPAWAHRAALDRAARDWATVLLMQQNAFSEAARHLAPAILALADAMSTLGSHVANNPITTARLEGLPPASAANEGEGPMKNYKILPVYQGHDISGYEIEIDGEATGWFFPTAAEAQAECSRQQELDRKRDPAATAKHEAIARALLARLEVRRYPYDCYIFNQETLHRVGFDGMVDILDVIEFIAEELAKADQQEAPPIHTDGI